MFASSSSVYGNAPRYPTYEDDVPRPHSPYGVTKLAAEHLCGLYAENYGIHAVSLRYFTVYGPTGSVPTWDSLVFWTPRSMTAPVPLLRRWRADS